jgi:hypothetical protein
MISCDHCCSEDSIVMERDVLGKNVFQICKYCEETVKKLGMTKGASLLVGQPSLAFINLPDHPHKRV